jgi:hypothetical protein
MDPLFVDDRIMEVIYAENKDTKSNKVIHIKFNIVSKNSF